MSRSSSATIGCDRVTISFCPIERTERRRSCQLTRRIEVGVREESFAFDFDSVDETVVEDGDESKVVFGNIADCRTACVVVLLICSR